MDLSNLMMLWNFLLAFYIVYADVIREDGYYNYEGQFTVKNKGRMLRVLMSFRNVKPEECALHCVRHLRCRTFNYRHGKKDCELTDEDFYEINADTISHGWHNYGTPKRVNGGWSTWRNFTECTKTCGGGTIEQWRDCDSPRSEHGGTNCKGKMRRRVKCNIQGCKVDGGWSSWVNSTTCTLTCGSGTLVQERFCNSPSPAYGGANCTGDQKKKVNCNTQKCPVHGKWSGWRNFTDCSKPCGNGTLEQRRNCDSPKPEYGGNDCDGQNNRTVECNTHECEVVNVAFGKKATQSSTFDKTGNFLPSKAVDGDMNTIAYTDLEDKPWWEVDLGEVKVIKKINLKTIVNIHMNLGLSVKTRKTKEDAWNVCYFIQNIKYDDTEINCHQITIAQFLRIESMTSCMLYIYEVEIFGY